MDSLRARFRDASSSPSSRSSRRICAKTFWTRRSSLSVELGAVERLQVLVGLDLALPQPLGQVHELAADQRDGHDRPADPLLAPLDLLPEPDLLLGVQEGDAADLSEVEADRDPRG